MHAARAALWIHDAEPKSHNAVRNMFGKYLVKTNEIESEYARILANEQDSRILANYLSDYNFSNEQAQDFYNDAERFVNRIKEYLISIGLELPQLDEE